MSVFGYAKAHVGSFRLPTFFVVAAALSAAFAGSAAAVDVPTPSNCRADAALPAGKVFCDKPVLTEANYPLVESDFSGNNCKPYRPDNTLLVCDATSRVIPEKVEGGDPVVPDRVDTSNDSTKDDSGDTSEGESKSPSGSGGKSTRSKSRSNKQTRPLPRCAKPLKAKASSMKSEGKDPASTNNSKGKCPVKGSEQKQQVAKS